MSNILRAPWLASFIRAKLNEVIAERDGGVVELGKALDTIGPAGELQFPGDIYKPLQVVEFLSLEGPVTAVLSDRTNTITCMFSASTRSEFESSHGRIGALKGGLIKPISYELQFLGVDGKLFWKGVTCQDQMANEPTSRKPNNQAKRDHRSNTKSGKPISSDRGTGNAKTNFRNLPLPEPMLLINSFAFIGSAGSEIWGILANITSKIEIKDLLMKLPKKKPTGEEITVGFNHNDPTKAPSPLEKRKKTSKSQLNGDPAQSLRKSPLSRPPKPFRNRDDLDGEVHRPPDLNDNEEQESQLAFATQAPGCFASTYDDLDFSPQAARKKKPKPKPKSMSPLTSPPALSSSFQSTGNSPQVVIVNPPQQTKTNMEKSGTRPKLINYSDEIGFGGSTAGSVMDRGAINNRRKSKLGQDGSLSESRFVEVNAETKKTLPKALKESLISRGWQGMAEVTKADTVIPKDQQEILDQPESWYPYSTNGYISGYSLIPKVQAIPKSHPPRDQLPPKVEVILPVAPTASQQSLSEDEVFPWPSSPIRAPERDINAMPPDSSMASGSQSHHAGSLTPQRNNQSKGARVKHCRSEDDTFSASQQEPAPRKGKFGEEKSSHFQSSLSSLSVDDNSEEREGMSEDAATGKRVTRAANGISKKAPIDPNNTEPSRITKAAQKPRVFAARKRQRAESEPEDEESSEYESFEELINDPDLPFEVVDRKARTRVAMFGGILKAQQVELWQKQKKKARDSEGNTGDETESDENGVQNGCDDHVSDELGFSHEACGRTDDQNVVQDTTVGPVVAKSDSIGGNKKPSENIQNTRDPLGISRPSGPGNGPAGVAADCHPEAAKPALPSGPDFMAIPGVTHDKIPELSPDSSAELPEANPINFDTDDDDEIPQAPLMPLNVIAGTQAEVSSLSQQHDLLSNRLKEKSAEPIGTCNNIQRAEAGGNNYLQLKVQPKDQALDDSRGKVVLLQTSSAPVVPDIPGGQGFAELSTSFLPSPAKGAAPTIQVEETPYGKACSKMKCDQSPSPMISKSRASVGYFEDEFDETLIPGTNTDFLHNSSESIRLRAARQSTLEQDSSPPEGQVISPNHILSSVETGNINITPLDDFSMSQQQLQREMQQHGEVEVPATSEVDEAKVEDAQSRPPLPRRRSKAKLKRLIKGVEFQSQEIRAANVHNDLSGFLEQQKKIFLGLKDGYNFGDLDFQGDSSSPAYKDFSGTPRAEVSKNYTSTNSIEIRHSPTPVRAYVSIESDEDIVSQPNIRKHHQSSPPDSPKSTKKPRADNSSKNKPHRPPTPVPLPRCPVGGGAPVGARKESPAVAAIASPINEDLMADDDIMAGPSATTSLRIDDNEPKPTLPRQAPCEPEIYAGLRERRLCVVPGYQKLTADQKNELDRRRQAYFGVTPPEGTERLFSVELQRRMQQASRSEKRRKVALEAGKAVKTAKTANPEWYRDDDARRPLEVFYKKFKELKQVKADLAARGIREDSGNNGI